MDNVWQLLQNAWSQTFWLMYFVVNLPIGLIAAVLGTWILKRFQCVLSKMTVASFVAIATFVPFIGCLCVIVGCVLFGLSKRKKQKLPVSIADYPEFKQEKRIQAVRFDAGGALQRLRNHELPVQERLYSLLSINASCSSDINAINRDMLHDRADELRLYAFGLLENQTNVINRAIVEYQSQLENSKDLLQTANLYKQLALSYWALFQFGLVQQDVLNYVFKQSMRYVNKALRHLKDDYVLYELLGRACLSRGKLLAATRYFTMALQHSAPAVRIIPYITQIDFRKKQYQRLRHHLSMNKSIEDMPKMRPLVKFWCNL